MPGPNIIFECPSCFHPMKMRTLASGNTFGSKLYSDGKRLSPMLPDPLTLTICSHCKTIFWTQKAKEIGEEYPWNEVKDEEWQYVKFAPSLDLSQYTKALNDKVYETREEEFYLRIMIWWGYNDRVRKGHPLFNETDEKHGLGEISWRENLQGLLNLLNPDRTDFQFMIADIYRSLGEFQKCRDIISLIKDPKLIKIKISYLEKCFNKDDKVFLLD